MTLDVNNKRISKQLKFAQEHLEPEEKVIEGVFGSYETKSLGKDTIKNGIFLATNKRLFFYGKRTFGFDSESFPYSNISSIEFGKKAMGYTLSFYASGNKVNMKWIKDGDIASLVNYVKTKMNEKYKPVSGLSAQQSVIEQIKELKELLDMEIISTEEFEVKKRQLLGL